MSEKEVHILSDKDVIPTDDYIFTILGDKKDLWKNIMTFATENYKDISGSWNYYNDGKQWLFKMVQKKKTVFWANILEDTFRITFYFGDKAESVIENSDLSGSIKDSFKNARKYGAIRPISIKIFELSDVENVIKLIVLKNKIK